MCAFSYHVHNHHWKHAERESKDIEQGQRDESFLGVQDIGRIAQHVSSKGHLVNQI